MPIPDERGLSLCYRQKVEDWLNRFAPLERQETLQAKQAVKRAAVVAQRTFSLKSDLELPPDGMDKQNAEFWDDNQKLEDRRKRLVNLKSEREHLKQLATQSASKHAAAALSPDIERANRRVTQLEQRPFKCGALKMLHGERR